MDTALARQCILFHGLSNQEAEQVLALGAEKTYRQGDTLTVQGSPADKVFTIVEGMVEIALNTREGERTLLYLGPGQMVGEISLIDGGPHSANARAVHNPTRVLVFDRSRLLDFCESHPHIGYILMRNIAADLAFKIRHHNLSTI